MQKVYWEILLSRYAGERDIPFCCPCVSGFAFSRLGSKSLIVLKYDAILVIFFSALLSNSL